MILKIRRLRIPAMQLMLASNEMVDLFAKLFAAHLDTGLPLPIVDKQDRQVNVIVCRSPVVVVIPDVEGEDGYAIPLVDGHKLGTARHGVDVEGATCSVDHLVVLKGIERRLLSLEDGDAHGALFLEHVDETLVER